MTEYITGILSLSAVLISGTTAYFTLFRRGTIKMSKPRVIYFGPDGGPKTGNSRKQKVFLRAILYSTGKRGHIIEDMYVKISRGESQQTFNIWVYGDNTYTRGSGLYVGENGFSSNHHFMLSDDGAGFRFTKGDYKVNIFASLAGSEKQIHLGKIDLNISESIEKELEEKDVGVYFDWGPDSKKYHTHIDRKKEKPDPKEILDLLGMEKD